MPDDTRPRSRASISRSAAESPEIFLITVNFLVPLRLVRWYTGRWPEGVRSTKNGRGGTLRAAGFVGWGFGSDCWDSDWTAVWKLEVGRGLGGGGGGGGLEVDVEVASIWDWLALAKVLLARRKGAGITDDVGTSTRRAGAAKARMRPAGRNIV